MVVFIHRRAVLLLAAAFLAAPAQAAGRFDGSWGAQVAPDETMQVVLVSGKITAFYWHGDYIDTGPAKPQAGGARLEFSFRGGSASLAMAGVDLAVTLHEQGQAVRHFVLKRD